MRRAVFTLLAISAVFAVVPPAYSLGPMNNTGMQRPSAMMGMKGDVDRMTVPGMNKACRTPEFYLYHSEILGLTTAQNDKMEAEYFELKRRMIEGGAKVKVLELKLTETVGKPDFSLDNAKNVLEEIESARTDLRKSVLESAAAARDILTPEQLDIVRTIKRPYVTGIPYMREGRLSGKETDGGAPDEDVIRRRMERKMKERMGAPDDF